MKKLLIALLLCSAFPPHLAAGQQGYPHAEYDRSNRRIIRLSNMATDIEGCEMQSMAGTIVGITYLEDGVEPTSIGLKLQSGERRLLYLSETFFQRIPNSDRGWLHTILSKGKMVRVKAYACGNGGIMTLDDIATAPRHR